MTPDPTFTVPLVPLVELLDLARLVESMRKAQRRYFHGRTGPDRYELLRASLDYEARVDARVKEVLERANQTPSLFGPETGGHRE